jgi:hypothetical protein
MNTTAASVPSTNYMKPALRGILLGGFFAGLADWIYPTVTTVMNGGSWMRPWKGVASGLLGAEAHQGGLGMVALGTLLHFFICFGAAAILYFVVSRLKWLPRQWPLLAVIHGVGVLLTMNYVILPLSAIGRGIYPLETLHISAFWHTVLVGIPTGYFVARALRQSGR